MSLAIAVAIAAYLFPPSQAQAQSLNVCETWVVDSYGTEQTNCLSEWYSGSTPQLTATVQVYSYDSNYVPAVDAYVSLSDPNGNLGTWDYDQGSEPTGPDSEAYAGITVALTPNDVYDVYGGYGGCWDASGNGGYYQDQWQCGTWMPYWSNPTEDLASSIFGPGYQVVSLLYPPPGNESTEGFGNFTTNGTTTSVGSSLEHSTEISFTGGTSLFGGGGSFTYSTTSSSTKAYQTTLTNQSTMTERANTLTAYNPLLLDMPDHHWDTFVIMMNPQITTASDDGGNVVGYAADLRTVSGAGWLTEPDPVNIVVQDILNGTVPENTLNQQPLPPLNGITYYQPGLASICQNLIQSEYDNHSCGQTDQCGCQLSDFKEILAQDDLLRWDKNNLTANPLPGWESPLDVDTSDNPPPPPGQLPPCYQPNPSLYCRYVPVPTSPTNPAPAEARLDYLGLPGFTQTDSTAATQMLVEQQSYRVGVSTYKGWDLQPFKAVLTETNTWKWTDSESTGTINGIGNSMYVNLATSNTGCQEDTFVYEDTRYHTFVVQPPDNIPNCKQ
ncbi:MAG: hypothetical protein ACLGRW_12495 [Acidobacteriota bacterium]